MTSLEAQTLDAARGDDQRSWRRRGFVWFVVVSVAMVFHFVFSAAENKLIFFPTRYPGGEWRPESLHFEDAWFETADGVRLHGWYLPVESPRAVVLFAHGNAGNITHRAEFMHYLRELNATALFFDYRGFGRSDGRPTEAGCYEDVRAARDWLSERAGVRPEDIVLMGESLGGAVAVDLAANDGARGLVLINTFASLRKAAAYHYPLLHRLMRSRYDSQSKIGRYHGPLLQFHGDADSIVPYEMGKELFEAANEPKRFVTVEEMDHNDPLDSRVWSEIDSFFNQLSDMKSTVDQQ